MSQQATDNGKCSHCAKINYVIVALLAGILATQIVMVWRMPASPPTIGTMRNAKTSAARVTQYQSIPLVRMQGGTIDADIQR